MREIRTYGLRRGCWLVRLRTAGWGLLDPLRGARGPEGAAARDRATGVEGRSRELLESSRVFPRAVKAAWNLVSS